MMMSGKRFHFIWILLFCVTEMLRSQSGQIDINRIELMSADPTPFILRDWKKVALGYDSMVYDISLTGEHLPLVFIKPEGVNYPENPSFGLDTYVGTFSNQNGEGINVLPSLVGASLAGIDKTNQFGQNWLLMSQDFFNHANGENIYLNNIGGHSGSDWWYDMMPNIYFYQLYDLYGNVGDAGYQFTTIADRMLEAVKAMEGSATPWTRASMNYRAWDFLHMQPNPNGVLEPEAAGAFAWLLYHAYQQTGDEKYLQGAEWSMEFLVNLGNNPSYELQLPYGASIAARMNAEIGTQYNIEKLLFWIFNRGPLRGWGTIVGEWNGFDVSGLVGEANDGGNDYAFQLNGLQQAGALVPLARYDKRFARAIGKWMLHVTNATRLMFPEFLPAHLQDASDWSSQYDPEGYIGYEALREVWNGMSPVATGDALKGGWAATNLSLYSTSSIGYLGAVVEETNVEKILQLDLLATDFFHDDAYPSYLYYNPHQETKEVSIQVGDEPVNILDVLSNTMLVSDVTGEVMFSIPADEAVSIVLVPANAVVTNDNDNILRYNGIAVDFRQDQFAYNFKPRIQAFATEAYIVEAGSEVTLYAKGLDQETKDLTYTFFLPDDTLAGLERTAVWTAPATEGLYSFMLVATDEALQHDTAWLSIEVQLEVNVSPVILALDAGSKYTQPGWAIQFHADVFDENGDVLNYAWSTNGGAIQGSGENVRWDAPLQEGVYTIQLNVDDGRGGSASASVSVLVIDLSGHVQGDLIAWYPFDGDAQDYSGHALHGVVSGAKLTEDFSGMPLHAYFFDGVNDHISVANDPILNFENGITVTGFVNPGTIGDKERFIISHGSWQNRWKISITPEGKLRWTLKNVSGAVRDLDSESTLLEDQTYHIACSYDGVYMQVYIDGRLESFTPFNGAIHASPVAMEIGQIMPDDASYSFRGVLDEIKIFDYALLPDSIFAESGEVMTSIETNENKNTVACVVFPNPARDFLHIQIAGALNAPAETLYTLTDIFGRPVTSGRWHTEDLTRFQISDVASGMYILHLRSADFHLTKSIYIQQ